MLINEDKAHGDYLITSCDDCSITVNKERYHHSLIITPTALITNWPMARASTLSSENLQPAIADKPEIVIIGCGLSFQPLPQAVLDYFSQLKIAVEGMKTTAACRTYMSLLAEQRQVAAALILESKDE